MEGYVTVTQAAKIKNVTRQAIYLAIKLNRLKAYKHKERWKVFLVDLRKYEENKFSRIYHSTVNGEPVFDEANGFYSVQKAAKMISVPCQHLYYALRRGKLKATRKKAAWVIHVSDLLEYQSRYAKKFCTSKCG